MSYKFEKLKKQWADSGYDGLLWIPIRTEIRLKGQEKHIINHKGISFVWVNGNEKFYPFVFLPIKGYSLNTDIITWNLESYKYFLEYISLLSFLNQNTRIDIDHKHFKNYSSSTFDPIDTQKPWIPKSNIEINIDKIEFKSNNVLSDKENLLFSLFREGNSVNNIFYSFLSFFKILELTLLKTKVGKNGRKTNDWSDMYDWIDNNLNKIKKTLLFKFSGGLGDGDIFLEQFKHSKKDRIGKYLLHQGRNAVAHAKLDKDPIKAPNMFNDYYEMYYASQFTKAAAYLLVCDALKTEIIIRKK